VCEYPGVSGIRRSLQRVLIRSAIVLSLSLFFWLHEGFLRGAIPSVAARWRREHAKGRGTVTISVRNEQFQISARRTESQRLSQAPISGARRR